MHDGKLQRASTDRPGMHPHERLGAQGHHDSEGKTLGWLHSDTHLSNTRIEEIQESALVRGPGPAA